MTSFLPGPDKPSLERAPGLVFHPQIWQTLQSQTQTYRPLREQRLGLSQSHCSVYHTAKENNMCIQLPSELRCRRKQYVHLSSLYTQRLCMDFFGEAPSRGVPPRFASFPPKFSRGHPASPRPPPALKFRLASQTKMLGGLPKA